MTKILLFTVCICLGLSAFADGDYKKRKNCWGFLSWRYKVTANVRVIGTNPKYSGDGRQDGTCNSLAQCTAAGIYKPFANSEPQVVATVTSKIGPNQPGQVTTWVHWQHTGIFLLGADPLQTPVNYPTVPMYQYATPDTLSPVYTGYGATVGTRDIIFDDRTHSVIIDGISGNLGVNVADMANCYSTIKIWVLDARNVTDEKDARVITSMQAFVLNGQLVLQGSFATQDFQQPDRDKAGFTISNITKTIAIDPSISLDDIIVRVGSDAGVSGQGITKDYQPDFNTPQVKAIVGQMEAEAAFKMNVLENPVRNNLGVSIANGQKTYNSVQLSITAATGETARQLYSGGMPAETRRFNVDVSALKPGLYYVTALTNTGERFTRKFIKQE